jgi:hypothetical protein
MRSRLCLPRPPQNVLTQGAGWKQSGLEQTRCFVGKSFFRRLGWCKTTPLAEHALLHSYRKAERNLRGRAVVR